MFRDFSSLFKTAAIGWWNDRAMSLSAALAFFTIFSLAPILLTAVAVAGLAFGREAAQGALVAELGGTLGQDAASAIETMIASASDVGSGLIGTAIGIVTFLVLLTGAAIELQDDLNLIWKAPQPASYGVADFIRSRVLSLALVLGIGFLLLVTLVVDAGLAALSTYLEARFSGATAILWVLNTAFAFAVAAGLFAMIFKILPNVALTWRDVATGAVTTALLFAAGKSLIGFYLGQSDLASTYGAAASIMTTMLWVYYSALILFFGAEFTKAYAESRGSRRGRRARERAEGAPGVTPAP